jgi:hypothetical protein
MSIIGYDTIISIHAAPLSSDHQRPTGQAAEDRIELEMQESMVGREYAGFRRGWRRDSVTVMSHLSRLL